MEGVRLEFSFELMDDSQINIYYQYGSTTFMFNLFTQYGEWTLHPFDGILLQNKEMCALVVAELLKNKDFHVLLARENITLTSLRTTIELNPRTVPAERQQRRGTDSNYDDKTDFIESNTFEDILEMEKEQLQERIAFFQDIISRMYMDGYGPEDEDFNKVQTLIRIYKETLQRLSDINGFDMKRRNDRRW